MEAVIFVGAQGSGKTTFYRQYFFETHVRISPDMLRTRRREQLLMAACLAAKQPFVIDNTNPLAGERARYLAEAKRAGFRVIGYFFQSSLQDAIRRNSQRVGKQKIPVPGVARTFRKLEAPRAEEGFDALYSVSISPEGTFQVVPHAPGDPTLDQRPSDPG